MPGLARVAMTIAALLAVMTMAEAQQTKRSTGGAPLLFDESGRQLEHPRDRSNRGQSRPASNAAAQKDVFGRVSGENGSFGLETQKKMKADQFPDGRPVPGVESLRIERPSPFVGLSLSVPTH